MSSITQDALESRLSVRLSWKWWIAVAFTAVLAAWLVPRFWWRWETLPAQSSYRIPHRHSNDYWLFRRQTARAVADDRVVVLGDSVIWGEYVLPEETLTEFLSRSSKTGRHSFANGGLSGMHPVAMSGLVSSHGKSLRKAAVVVHCNLLWLSSPERDLRVDEEVSFNHPELVPQFGVRIPSYRATQSERLRNVIRRNSLLFTWVDHLREAHFDGQDFHHWSMEHPYENPLRRIEIAASRPTQQLRHRAIPWHERGITMTDMDWAVDDIGDSLQWQGFLRTLRKLRKRRNKVLVIVGPLNVHMLKPKSRQTLQDLRSQVASQLEERNVPHVLLQPPPSDLYADASHPLPDGYKQLAAQLTRNGAFVAWLAETVQ